MKSLTAEHNYEKAAEIADTINWNKIKNVNALVKVGESEISCSLSVFLPQRGVPRRFLR